MYVQQSPRAGQSQPRPPHFQYPGTPAIPKKRIFPYRFGPPRSEEHTSELQSPCNLVCRLLLEKKKMLSMIAPQGSLVISGHYPCPNLATNVTSLAGVSYDFYPVLIPFATPALSQISICFIASA